MHFITFFTIEPILSGHAPMGMFIQDEKNELALSPNVRLCGIPLIAHIESEALAHQFAEACTPRLQKRYGNQTTLEVHQCEAVENPKLLDRIKNDSDIIRKRLATGNLAPNKKP